MIRKAVIPVAGWGTRVLPATKAVPKPLLPVADLPTLQYVVEEAVAAGIDHIILITNRHMRAIEDYFDENPELTRTLEAKNNTRMLERLRHIESLARFSYVRQSQPRGLGHAILMARAIIGDTEPFAVLLGDDVMYSPAGPNCLGQLVARAEQLQASVISTMRVLPQEVSRYGVIAGEQLEPHLFRVRGLVEKPPVHEAPSNLAVVGRYILSPRIFSLLEKTPPGKGGEIQLTDALAMLLQFETIYGLEFNGQRYDTGDTVGWLTTSIDFTLRRPDLAPALKAYLRTLDLTE